MTVHRVPPLSGAIGLCALLVLGGCGGIDLPPDVPAHRPPDGLLGDAELQAVVELQVLRDGPGIVAYLQSERPAVRARAAFALASVQDTAAVPDLVEALADPDAGVRRDAAFALGQAHSPAAVGPLAETFATEADGEVRRRILEALSKLPTVEAAGALLDLEVRADEEADLTLALARLGAVGAVATPETQEFLLARLGHMDPRVRTSAAYYFGRLAQAAPWAPHAPRVRQALDGYRSSAPEAMYLVQALGKLADAQDGPRLREWLARADDWRVRSNAAAALAALPPDPTSRESLLRALDDPAVLVSDQAAQSLARGDALPSELPHLEAWITAHGERGPAVAALLTLLAAADDRDFVFAWLDALAPGDVQGWSAGLRALGAMPGQEAAARLLRAAGAEDARIQGAAVAALAQRWTRDRLVEENTAQYFQAFSQALVSGNVQAAARAAAALADPTFAPLGNVAVLTEAFHGMRDPEDLEAMTAVLDALGASGSPDAVPVVREALGHPTPAVQRAAARSLAELGGEAPSPRSERGPAASRAETPALDWAYLVGLGSAPRWTLETDRGTLVVRLDPEEAPLTVQTLARLSQEGRFDGVSFHRVVPNFVAQGGDVGAGDGSGGPGFAIKSEFTEVPYLRGSAGMASAGKDTEGSQFFFTHSMQPHLDGSYTNFGWVISGMDVVDRLDVGDRILRATVEPGG